MTQRTCSSCGAHVADVDDRCRTCDSDPEMRLLELGAGERVVDFGGFQPAEHLVFVVPDR